MSNPSTYGPAVTSTTKIRPSSPARHGRIDGALIKRKTSSVNMVDTQDCESLAMPRHDRAQSAASTRAHTLHASQNDIVPEAGPQGERASGVSDTLSLASCARASRGLDGGTACADARHAQKRRALDERMRLDRGRGLGKYRRAGVRPKIQRCGKATTKTG